MELDFLDDDGKRVMRRARELAAEGESADRAFVTALAEDRGARVLAAAVYRDAHAAIIALRPSVAHEGLVRLAYEQARDFGRMIAGPEELLIAAIRTSPTVGDLEEGGMTVESLVRARARTPFTPTTTPPPATVWLCSASLLGQALCCACPLTLPSMSAVAAGPDLMVFLMTADTFWTLVLCLLLGVGLLGSESGVWAGATAFQMARTVAVLALGAYHLTRPDPPNILMLWAALPTGFTAWALFRHRAWFQVPEREKWRTLWRRGGWVLVTTLGLDLGLLTLAMVGGKG